MNILSVLNNCIYKIIKININFVEMRDGDNNFKKRR
jgi:hypothetical protein